MRQVVTTICYLLVTIVTTAFAGDIVERDGVLVTAEDYPETHGNIRDPIVNFALRIFHSLEDFRNDNYKHSAETTERDHVIEKRNKMNKAFISEEHIENHKTNNTGNVGIANDELEQELPIKYTIVEDYHNVLGYKNMNMPNQEKVAKIVNPSQNFKAETFEDPVINIVPFDFNFNFLSGEEEFKSNENDMVEKTTQFVEGTIFEESSVIKKISKPELLKFVARSSITRNDIAEQPQMQVLGQSVEMENFWQFDREMGK